MIHMGGCEPKREILVGTGPVKVNGEVVIGDAELVAIAEVSRCRDEFLDGKYTVAVNNVIKVGIVVDGKEYVLAEFKEKNTKRGKDVPWVLTKVVTHDEHNAIGEALIEGGWVRLPNCVGCGVGVRRVIEAVNSGYMVHVTMDLGRRRVLEVELINPSRERELWSNWFTTPVGGGGWA